MSCGGGGAESFSGCSGEDRMCPCPVWGSTADREHWLAFSVMDTHVLHPSVTHSLAVVG